MQPPCVMRLGLITTVKNKKHVSSVYNLLLFLSCDAFDFATLCTGVDSSVINRVVITGMGRQITFSRERKRYTHNRKPTADL